MYKSDRHRLMTEKWTGEMKVKNYAEATLYSKVLDSPREVYESLLGRTGKDKARNLLRSFATTPEATATTSGLEWDSRVVVPIGTIIRSGHENSGANKYRLISIKDAYYVMMKPLDGQNKEISSRGDISYSLKDFNSQLKNRQWCLIDATPEHYKVIGVPPKQVLKYKNGNGYYTLTTMVDRNEFNAGTLYSGPTGNCQLCLLGSAQNLLTYVKTAEDVKNAFKEISKISGKRLILMDIKTSLVSNLKSKFPEGTLTVNTAYTSTNGSAMSIVLLNTSKY